MVKNRQSKIEQDTKQIVKQRAIEAYQIATSIYNKYKNIKKDKEIEGLIIESLRDIRYLDKNGYYFITRVDGIEMLFADKPQMEGKNLLNVQDSHGKFVVKDMIGLTAKNKEGFYSYHWSKPNKIGENYEKISYVKLFEPFGWVIGTGLYVDDVSELVKQNILEDRHFLNYDPNSDNYIFIGTWEGVSLSYPAKNKNVLEIQDANGKYIVKELIQKAKEGSGFVEYIMPKLGKEDNIQKISYVEGIKEWQWYVGAGVYIDNSTFAHRFQ